MSLGESMGLCFVPHPAERTSPPPSGHNGTCLTAACAGPQGWARCGLGSQVWRSRCLGRDLREVGKEPEHPLPAGFLCLCSENALVFVLGIAVLGVCHYTLTVKGSHLATHGALTESKRWSRIWALFFVEVSAGGGGGWAAAGTMGATSLSMPAGVTDTAGILVQGLGLTPG